jgi:hypothetical protein
MLRKSMEMYLNEFGLLLVERINLWSGLNTEIKLD